MLNAPMLDALNQQISREFASERLYLSMAAYAERQALPGIAHWLMRQSGEERDHALRLFALVCDRGGRVLLGAMDQPPAEFGTARQLFERVLDHERSISAAIHGVFELALAEKDYATQVALGWFISEQVEEEKTAALIVDQLKAFPEGSSALLYLDRQLGKRA